MTIRRFIRLHPWTIRYWTLCVAATILGATMKEVLPL